MPDERTDAQPHDGTTFRVLFTMTNGDPFASHFDTLAEAKEYAKVRWDHDRHDSAHILQIDIYEIRKRKVFGLPEASEVS